MKIALVHDDFLQWGGAERVVQALSEIWPKAPIYTSVADNEIIKKWIGKRTVIQSPLRYAPYIKQLRKVYLPFYPLVFQSMEIGHFDVVLSSSARFAHTIKLTNGTRHVSYCHAPPRFIWRFENYIQNEQYPILKKLVLRPTIGYFKETDTNAMSRVDEIIANSRHVAKQIKAIYKRKAKIVTPFVDTKLFSPLQMTSDGKYYLVVSRLVSWKRIDLAIEACKQLQFPLLIIGKGDDKKRLQYLAQGANIEFLEDLTDKQLVYYYRNSKALLITQEEDFGLTSLEAQACGRPVLAFAKGGSLETVVKGKTGDYFRQQTATSLVSKLKNFHYATYSAKDCVENAQRFNKQRFQATIKEYIDRG